MLDWLAQQAGRNPGKIALITRENVWTYHQLNLDVARMAAWLTSNEISAGDHIACLLSNRPEYVILIHALIRMKAILVPLNIRLTGDEISYQLSQSECSVLITDHSENLGDVRVRSPKILALQPGRVLSPGELFIGEPVSEMAIQEWKSGELELGQMQGIIYTSGTTGKPKGVMLTVENHFWNAVASSYRIGIFTGDRWLACMPLYHVGGQAIILRCCLYGIAVVLLEKFDEEVVEQTILNQAITVVSFVPTMLSRLLARSQDPHIWRSVRCILVGGGPLPESLQQKCQSLGLPVSATYGLTEAASQVATMHLGVFSKKPGSAGTPLLFNELRIANNLGLTCALYEPGEIVVKGRFTARGYYNDRESTEDRFKDGELYTGDIGYLDEDGDLWVLQRRDDLIVTGGENVYPFEVESVLFGHPAVQESCVFAVDDDNWGQVVCAAVVLQAGEQASENVLIEYCRQFLGGYKLPRRFYILDDLPHTQTGKIDRLALKEKYKNEKIDNK